MVQPDEVTARRISSVRVPLDPGKESPRSMVGRPRMFHLCIEPDTY